MEFELVEPPSDGISRVLFSRTSKFLAVSSWDQNVRLYDTDLNLLCLKADVKTPLLDVCYSPCETRLYSGGLDTLVHVTDLASGASHSLSGLHTAPVKSVCRVGEHCVLSGGWDGLVALWDVRAGGAVRAQAVLEERVYSMDACGGAVSVALAGRLFRHFTVSDAAELVPVCTRESSLRHQTRCTRVFSWASRGVLISAASSIEGRVSLDPFYPPTSTSTSTSVFKKYAFKCHRQVTKQNTPALPVESETIFPVNALDHLELSTGSLVFGTAGSDGLVYFWDAGAKKRVAKAGPYPTSVASISMARAQGDGNGDGDGNMVKVAVASSYTFDQGQRE